MSVDTADKRFSFMGYDGESAIVYPIPNGGFTSAGDRLQMLGLYRGVVAVAVVPSAPGMEFTLRDSRMHYTLKPSLMHYTLPDSRLHSTVGTEDE